MAKVEIEGLPEDYSVEDDEDFVYLKKKGEEKVMLAFRHRLSCQSAL